LKQESEMSNEPEMVPAMIFGLDDDGMPAPIFLSKACRQLGIPSEMQPTTREDGQGATIRVRLPTMPKETFETVKTRAKFLQQRDKEGLPTEQLPSGRWPDSLDEFADQVPLVVVADEEKGSVYLDFGRPIQAIGVSPAMARTISTLIMGVANEVDPDGQLAYSRPELVNVARVTVPGKKIEQEGTMVLPALIGSLQEKLDGEEGAGEPGSNGGVS
jgi:hypothetical protein